MRNIESMNPKSESKKLYYTDPYINRFDAAVIGCIPCDKGYEIELDRTAFYPEGGGQPADTGIIGGIAVTDVRERDGCVIHITSHELKPGVHVNCEVDWQRRFIYMQHHTGEHIISGLVKRLYGLDNVGFHMKKGVAAGHDKDGLALNLADIGELTTIDLNGVLKPEDIYRLESAANEAVYRNLPVETVFPSQDELAVLDCRSKKALSTLMGDIRIVRIPGYDICACCGMHVTATGEIGIIKLVTAQNYKGGMRLSMLCGKAAFEDYYSKNSNIYKISATLSAKPGEIVDAVDALGTDNIRLKKRIWEIQSKLFKKTARQICYCEKVCIFEDGLDSKEIKQFHTILCEHGCKVVAVFSGDDAKGYKYAIGGPGIDSSELNNELTAGLNGRGGGSKDLAQGTVMTTRSKINKYFADRFWNVFGLYN